MTDHLARLCFDGTNSIGWYTPQALRLRLNGTEQRADHIVYLHEVHHAALNDQTAWGSALHVYARLGDDAGHEFQALLDACRTTHESLATFASVQIASARHGRLDEILAAYPDYVPLYDTTCRLTNGVAGANRRQLVATALARLCMQTPILDEITARGLTTFRLAHLRDIDRPDARWNWFQRRHPGALATAATTADRLTVAAFGADVLDSDGPDSDLYASTERAHDEAWEHWEQSAYDQLRVVLAESGARTLDFNGHQDGTAALVTAAEASHGSLGLRAAMPDDQRHDDAALASAILQQVRHDISGADRYRACLLPPLPAAEVVDMMSDPIIAGRPALVIDARPAHRLAALYRWPDDPATTEDPVVAIRVIADDDGPDSVIAHHVIADPADAAALSAAWQGRGRLISCVSASCLADQEWTARWIPRLHELGPLFVLVDVEPDRFVPRWARAGSTVTVVGVEVSDTGGQRGALVFTPDNGVGWWLVVADDVTIRLMAEYLRGLLGDRMRTDPDLLAPVHDATTVAITHLLATESFTSFDAIGTTDAG